MSILNNNFHCDECGKQCVNERKFKLHMKSHERSPQIFCDKCNKSFPKRHFALHLKSVHSDGTLPASNQENFLITKQNLEKRLYRCKMCVYESTDETTLKNHISAEQHNGNLENQGANCPYCEYKSKHGLHNVKVHVDRKHPNHGAKNYFCHICNKGYIFDYSYYNHVHIKQKKEERKICEICDIKVLSLKAHKSEKHLTCSYCNWQTPTYDKWQSALQYHIDSNHPEHGEKKFFCSECPKTFMFEKVFLDHQRNRHTKIQKKYICEICAIEYMSPVGLKQHMLKEHRSPDATDFICDVCGFSTFSKVKLKRHVLEKHEIEKHKCCPYCDYRYPDQAHVDRHIDRKHPEHGEKQYFCDVCGKGFIFKASLKDHPQYYCPKNPKFIGRTKKF